MQFQQNSYIQISPIKTNVFHSPPLPPSAILMLKVNHEERKGERGRERIPESAREFDAEPMTRERRGGVCVSGGGSLNLEATSSEMSIYLCTSNNTIKQKKKGEEGR